MTGILYIVATPIGNLSDISKRALDTLQQVDLITAEDTRYSGRLLQHFAINTPMLSFHQHNEAQRTEQIIKKLQSGQNIALISDAGTPLISDPGFKLVQQARQAGITIVPIPGACAAITALSAAGLPCDQFIFVGFLPAKEQQRQQRLQQLVKQPLTMVFYEAPHRILALIDDLALVFGEQRLAVLARELTKLYETILTGTLMELQGLLKEDNQQQRGEFVVIVEGASVIDNEDSVRGEEVLHILLEELPPRQAAKLAARISHEKVNKLYKLALEQQKNDGN